MILKRFEQTGKVIRGVLIFNEEAIALTLENPWRDNEPNVSCIPVATYTCKRVESPKFGLTYEVTGVDGRTHILFHSGNLEKNTKGCILLGDRIGELHGEPAVLNSRKTVARFMDITKDFDTFELSVVAV